MVKSRRQARHVISPLEAVRSALESSLSPGEPMLLGAAERDSGTNINVSTSRAGGGGDEINGDVYSLSILVTFSIRIVFFIFPFSYSTFYPLCLSPLADISYPLASLFIRTSLSCSLYYCCFASANSYFIHAFLRISNAWLERRCSNFFAVASKHVKILPFYSHVTIIGLLPSDILQHTTPPVVETY